MAKINGRDVSLEEAFEAMKRSDGLAGVRGALKDRAVEQTARERGISASDDELQAGADAFRRQRGLHSSSATQQWLKQAGLSVDDFEGMIESRLLRDKLKQDVVSEEQIEAYFAEHKRSFDRAELSEIRVDDAGKAEELAAQLQDEEAEFLDLAAKHAVTEAARHACGYVGWLERRSLSPVLEAVVFEAKPGDVTDPAKTDAGWHIIKVWQVSDAKLDDALRQRIRDHLFDKWSAENGTADGLTITV